MSTTTTVPRYFVGRVNNSEYMSGMSKVFADAVEPELDPTSVGRIPEASSSSTSGGAGGRASVLASRIRLAGFSTVDQALAVGGMFLANIALARVRSKEEYGIFALSYSIYTFLTGLHNAAILEPYTVLGSGRYHK